MNVKKISLSLIVLINCFTNILPCSIDNTLTVIKNLKKFKKTGCCVGCDLADQDLREIFKEIRARDPHHIINLQGANLNRANISGVFAPKTNFSNAQMRDTIATYAFLNEANFENTCIHRIKLEYALLYKAIFKKTHCGGANFAYADLVKANFEEALLEPSGCQVYGPANMGSFYKANAKWANFKNTRWCFFHTKDADFTGANFTGAKNWFEYKFKDAIMTDVIYPEDRK
ncbi:MAG TPA: pentapeptide repeat-containing protein [Candidatus Babeliales bacterium]|nr:pentapeptide repeat-containing protein [Candidatus Babeliales bacterium]